MKPSTVDEFIETRVVPEHREVVAMLRSLMRETAPGVRELISYGIPAYKGNRILAVISPTKKDITFSFSRGAQFEDPYHLLRGRGKSSKHVKISDARKANWEAIRHYIRQAVELDAG
jgi:hypothetical protein